MPYLPTTFATLDHLLHRKGTDKPVPSRKVANNTYAQRRDESSIAIKLHATDVVTHHRDGRIVLNTGGWHTVTTKQRMNDFTPRYVQVFSDKGRWMVAHLRKPGLEYGPSYDTPTPYADDMVLTPVLGGLDGEYVASGGTSPAQRQREDAHNRQIEKLMDKWLRGLTEELRAERLKWPFDHDTCALCLPLGRSYGTRPTSIGEQMGDTQHLIEHLFEKQYPADLFKHATNIVNPSGLRAEHLGMLKVDLRNYLRATLLVGPISTRGARRVA